MSLYIQVAREFEDQIRGGLLPPGERLPSVRTLSRNRRISTSTVLQAYMTLEAKGLIEARPQSGYYALAPLTASAPDMVMPQRPIQYGEVRTADILAEMRRASRNKDFFQLGCAHMATEIYPLKRLGRLLGHIARDRPEVIGKMDFPPGNPRLRRLIAKRYAELGCRVKSDDIVLTSGCNEALLLTLQSCTRPGDNVLVESPTYFGLLEILQQLGLKAVEVPSDARRGVDLEAVRKAFSRYKIQAGFVIPCFSNPTGSLMPDENKQALVRIFEKHRAWLIEDDIFGELSFKQTRPKPLKYFETQGRVITCSSFSKTVGPGLRLGWVLPGELSEAIENSKYLLNGGTPLTNTELVADFLESGSYERYLRKVRQTLDLQVSRIAEAVIRSFPKGTEISQPEGGFVLWVKLPPGTDSLKLYSKAADAKINVTPGAIFSPSGNYAGYLRLSCGAWSDSIAKAIGKLGSLVS